MTTVLKKIKIYALLLAPGLLVFAPLLFFSRAFADGDTVLQQYTSFSFLAEAFKNGDSFFWNPHVLTGFIPVVGLMGGLLSWANQLVYQLGSVITVFSWVTFVNFSLTGIFIYELVRKLGLRPVSAIFAGLTLPWIGAYFIWAANMTVSSGHVLLPALLYFFLVLRDSRSVRKSFVVAIFGGAFIGTIMLAAHFQWSLQAIAVSVLWALFLDVRDFRNTSFRVFRFQTLAFGLLTLVTALLIFFPQFEASYFAQEFSARAEGVSFAEVLIGSVLPLDSLSLVFPDLSLPFGVSQPGIFYIGAMPLLALLFSVFAKKDAFYKFFAWTAVLTLLVSIKYSPLMWLVHQLPLFDSFRALSRFVYVGLVAAVILSAYGFEYILSSQFSEKARKLISLLWKGSLAMLVLFIVWSLSFGYISKFISQRAVIYFDQSYSAERYSLPKEHYYQVIEQLINRIQEGTVFPSIPVSSAVIFLVIGSGLIYYRRKLSANKFLFVSLLSVALNFLIINSASLPTIDARILDNPPEPAVYLQANDQSDFRIFTFLSGFTLFDRLDTPFGYQPAENIELQKNILRPNINMLYKIDSLDYYDNLLDRRHSRILAYLGSDRSQESEGKLAELDVSFDEKKSLFLERLPLLSQYNVKYIISAYPLVHSDLQEVLRFAATSYDIPLYLYENLKVRQRYYMTGDVVFSPPLSENDSWQKNLETASKQLTLVECDKCPDNVPGRASLQLVSESNAEYIFNVESETSQLFVFGLNFLPGWHAEVDAQSVEIYRANFVNQAISIPAGTHQVVFRFSL